MYLEMQHKIVFGARNDIDMYVVQSMHCCERKLIKFDSSRLEEQKYFFFITANSRLIVVGTRGTTNLTNDTLQIILIIAHKERVYLSTPMKKLNFHMNLQVLEFNKIDMSEAYQLHYRKPVVCQVPQALPRVIHRTLGKLAFCRDRRKNSQQTKHTRQISSLPSTKIKALRFLCRVLSISHSAKLSTYPPRATTVRRPLSTATAVSVCRVSSTDTRQRFKFAKSFPEPLGKGSSLPSVYFDTRQI